MAYNRLVQDEDDALSNSGDSQPRGSLQEAHCAFPPLSPSLNKHLDSNESPITRSREGSIPMRHPTPGLESLQGAYTGNVVRLEQSAERLSLSSDIGEEIRKMKLEQQRSESRRSSIQPSQSEEVLSWMFLNRQLSYGQRSHASNSIVEMNSVARSGGFSPAAYFASPRGSVKSGSWSTHNSVKGRSASQGPRLTQVTEPEQEGKPLDSPLSTRFAVAIPPLPSQTRPLEVVDDSGAILNNNEVPLTHSPEVDQGQEQEPADDEKEPRPSEDTSCQANGLFLDFDGTHTEDPLTEPPPPPLPDHVVSKRRSSQLLQMEPQTQDDIVYYPAPVPIMLNLPQRLSKLPAAPKRAQRHTQLLDSLHHDARKSAAWLPDMAETAGDDEPPNTQARDHRPMADLPPQLRATMFFDYPSARQDVAVKGESAVATLDSILDASAFAPVSAFTDHPIVGRVGADIYGTAPVKSRATMIAPGLTDMRKRRSSVQNLLKRSGTSELLNGGEKRKSSLMSLGNLGKRMSSGQQFEDAPEHQEDTATDVYGEEAPLQDNHDAHDQEFEDAQEGITGQPEVEDNGENEFTGAPTTLLAELQLRKQQQKKRTRTAATAFPDGIHSTLLQLDAVAQVEKQARFKKHTTLAWEDPQAYHPGIENEDDEDVPLGMLFPARQIDEREKSRRFDEDRPLGLIARRELEDNEPLSHRRARLRGEPLIRDQCMTQRDFMHTPDLPNMPSQELDETQSDDEDLGETLAQRRERLKATQISIAPRQVSTDFTSEILTHFGGLEPSPLPVDSPDPIKRTSTKTPDLDGVEETLGQRRKRLQAEAASRNASGDQINNTSAARPTMTKRRSMADILHAHPAAGAGFRSVSSEVKYAPPPKMRNTAWAANVNRQAGLGGMVMGAGPMSGYANGYSAVAAGQVDVRQGDMIDRWRQSVGY